MSQTLELAKFLVTVIGGGGAVSWYATRRSDRLAQYRYLDTAYRDLLSTYAKRPEFGDPEKTANFAAAFVEKERLEYHYFAMSVNNFLETLYDVFKRPAKRLEWGRIFVHHASLHWSWLKANEGAFEHGFLEYVSNHMINDAQRAKKAA